jgi:hypothetical protein
VGAVITRLLAVRADTGESLAHTRAQGQGQHPARVRAVHRRADRPRAPRRLRRDDHHSRRLGV